MNAAPACFDVVGDGLQKALRGRAIQHAQHAGICLGGKELEDGKHAPRADVLAVQEAQRIRYGIPVAAKNHEKVMAFDGPYQVLLFTTPSFLKPRHQ